MWCGDDPVRPGKSWKACKTLQREGNQFPPGLLDVQLAELLEHLPPGNLRAAV